MSKIDLISTEFFKKKDIYKILEVAETMRILLKGSSRNAPHLTGKTVLLYFPVNDTKTKLEFQLASEFLSASVVDVTTHESQLKNYQSNYDMANLIEQMRGNVVVSSTAIAGSARHLSSKISASVINAGDGYNENPSQCFDTLFLIKRYKGDIENLKVCLIGDVLHSNVCKSYIFALNELGAKVSLSAPSTLLPVGFEALPVEIHYQPEEAIKDADAIICLPLLDDFDEYKSYLPSINEYKKGYKIDQELLEYAKDDAIVIVNGEPKRGIEVSSRVDIINQTLVGEMTNNCIAVKMALLYLLT